MTDPRLQSFHLSGERRDDFRQARSRVIQARGTATYDLEQHGDDSSRIDQTAVQSELIKNMKADFVLIFRSELAFPLHVGLNTIGRFRNNDIVLDPRYISRRHCGILIHSQGKCELFDFASRNGTYRNNARVEKSVRLASGDHIRLCDQHFIFFARAEKSSETLSGP